MAINALPEEYILNNDYKILESLGQGGFGITYLAEDMSLGHQVVIKEFLPQSMAVRDQSHYTVSPYTQEDALYSKMLKRFIEEARLIAGLNHPNIVKVTRLLEANDTAYFVMPYEEGETLEDYLDHVPKLKESDILQIMMPILEGTKYVHANGVLHRDIAPDNIYLKQNGMPMLIDFGAARNAIAQKSQTISAIAKDGYSPPEQYTPNTDQTAATDVYALGAVFYRMITGNKPASSSQRQMAVLEEHPDPIGELAKNYKGKYSKTLLEAVDKAMSLRQTQRFQSIQEFQKAISEGVIVEPPKRPRKKQTTGKEPQKSKIGIIGFILVLLVVLGVVSYQYIDNQKIEERKQLEEKKVEEAKTRKEKAEREAREKAKVAEEERIRQEKISEKKRLEAERIEKEKAEQEAKEKTKKPSLKKYKYRPEPTKMKIKSKQHGDILNVKFLLENQMLPEDYIEHATLSVGDRIVFDMSNSSYLSKNPLIKVKTRNYEIDEKLTLTIIGNKGTKGSKSTRIKRGTVFTGEKQILEKGELYDYRKSHPKLWQARTVTNASKILYGDIAYNEGDLEIKIPTVAANGNFIPITIRSDIELESLAFLSNVNPYSTIAVFSVPKGTKVDYSLRFRAKKYGERYVMIIAKGRDGKFYRSIKSFHVAQPGM